MTHTSTPERPRLSGYDVLIFDCDGVLIDSNSAKTRAFEEVAVDFGYGPDTAAKFGSWQSRNFGISRYRVFDELLSGRFGDSEGDVNALTLSGLVRDFGERAKEIYETASETLGVRSLLASLSTQRLYVASGSDQAELRDAFERRRLSEYFVKVYGSPVTKRQLVVDIVESERNRLGRMPRALMLGDAASDADAAAQAHIDFIFIASYSSDRESMLERCTREALPHAETLADLLRENSRNSSQEGS